MLLFATETCNRAFEIRLRGPEAQGSYSDPETGCPYSLSLSSQMPGRCTPGHMQRRVYCLLSPYRSTACKQRHGAYSSNLRSPLPSLYPKETVAKLQESDVTTKLMSFVRVLKPGHPWWRCQLWPTPTTALWCRCCSVERKHAQQVNVTLAEMGTGNCEMCLLATGWHKSKIPCSPEWLYRSFWTTCCLHLQGSYLTAPFRRTK